MRRRSRFSIVAATLVVTGVVVAGVVALPGTGQAAGPKVTHSKKAPLVYLSLGDSYSVGYQNPTITNGPGYTDKVAKKEHMTLENFGCGGATTTSLLTTIGCSGSQETTHEVLYPTTTQEAAALTRSSPPTRGRSASSPSPSAGTT